MWFLNTTKLINGMPDMTTKSPLYFTGKTPDGKLLLGGVFRMHDQEGFPIEASFEECQRKGWQVDWAEALADCWLNDPMKMDNFVGQAALLGVAGLGDKFAYICEHLYLDIPDDSACTFEVCRRILSEKQLNCIRP